MLTIQALRDWGADVDDGIKRCVGQEAFYLRMVGKIKNDAQRMPALKDAIARKDYKEGFIHAHTLKGALANLALTPALKPIGEISDLLKNQVETDYGPLLEEAEKQMDSLMMIIG